LSSPEKSRIIKDVPHKSINAIAVLQDTLELFKKYFKEILVVTVFNFAVSQFRSSSLNTYYVFFYGVLNIIISAIIMVVILWFIDQREKGKAINLISAIKQSLPHFFPVVITFATQSVIVLIGSVMFIIPGVIAIIVFSQATLLTLFDSKNVKQALLGSWELTSGSRIVISLLFLSYFALTGLVFFIQSRVGLSSSSQISQLFPTVFYYPLTFAIWRALKKSSPN